ncbi:MAG: pyridoxal-dependent decarboxylase, partial [Acidimicrobiia bacterium]|nr:pyridoxal-dependent decarboxylase [Acidimicrobiia bacterium]
MPDSFHMTPDEFRRRGAELIEWIATYMEQVEAYPVGSTSQPGKVRSQLPASPPATGEKWDEILADLDTIVMPGITHWQSPGFYAFFNGNNSGPSILGELAAAGLGTQGMMWATSPAATELETHVLDWLAEMVDLPEQFRSTATGGGVVNDTASTSTLIAAIAARERATDYAANDTGVVGNLTAYTSAQAHSSVEKAVRLAGIGSDNLRLIDTDDNFAMRPEALAAALESDVAAGLTPAFITASVGTTSSLAMDPLRPIGELARRFGAWLHVDAAWAGSAAICPEFRYLQDGLELADSYLFNPHKWLFTNVEFSAFYVADRQALIRTMGLSPEYLRNQASDSGEVIDYRDWQISLGRRFRALKMWFVIRHYGVEGLQHHIREHVRLGQELAERVRQHPQLELAAPANLNLVCFTHKDGDAASKAILDAVNASGDAFLSH